MATAKEPKTNGGAQEQGQEQQQPNFGLQRIYVKDISFETL